MLAFLTAGCGPHTSPTTAGQPPTNHTQSATTLAAPTPQSPAPTERTALLRTLCETEGVARPESLHPDDEFRLFTMAGPFPSVLEYCACLDASLAANERSLREAGAAASATAAACAGTPTPVTDLPSVTSNGALMRAEFFEVRVATGPRRALGVQTNAGWYFALSPTTPWRDSDGSNEGERHVEVSAMSMRSLVDGHAPTLDFLTTSTTDFARNSLEMRTRTICGIRSDSTLACTQLVESLTTISGPGHRRSVDFAIAYQFANDATRLQCSGRCARSHEAGCFDIAADTDVCAHPMGPLPFP